MVAAGAFATTVLVVVSGLPVLLAFPPALVLGALLCFRWPAAAVVGTIFLTGTAGSLTAFTPIPPNGTINLMLAGIWAGVVWRLMTGRADRPVRLWPGVVLIAAFVTVTGLWVLADTDTFGVSLHSFRLTPWFMMAFLLVALAPWSAATHLRIARGAVLVFLAVGAYSSLRKLIGPAEAEVLVARVNMPGLPFSQPAPFTGSFLHAQMLGSWCAFSIPFALALAFTWRDRWRVVAILAVAACTFALFAADRRAATVGAIAGVVVVLVLLVLAARSFRGARIGMAVLAVVAIALVGGVSYLTTIARDPGAADRFESLITSPETDETYQIRLSRWSPVLESLNEHPFGHGLGTVGAVPRTSGAVEEIDPSSINPILDSSYLKIAYEQGLGGLILFAIAYLALIGGLAWRAVRTSDRTRAGLAIAACGTLGALIPIFYASLMIEGATVAAAWLLAGLGAAGFTRAQAPPAGPGAGARREAAAPPALTPTSPGTTIPSGHASGPPQAPALR